MGAGVGRIHVGHHVCLGCTQLWPWDCSTWTLNDCGSFCLSLLILSVVFACHLLLLNNQGIVHFQTHKLGLHFYFSLRAWVPVYLPNFNPVFFFSFSSRSSVFLSNRIPPADSVSVPRDSSFLLQTSLLQPIPSAPA